MNNQLMHVRDLIKALKNVPADAVIMVRVQHDASFNAGTEGYEPAWGNIFYSPEDNSLNIE